MGDRTLSDPKRNTAIRQRPLEIVDYQRRLLSPIDIEFGNLSFHDDLEFLSIARERGRHRTRIRLESHREAYSMGILGSKCIASNGSCVADLAIVHFWVECRGTRNANDPSRETRSQRNREIPEEHSAGYRQKGLIQLCRRGAILRALLLDLRRSRNPALRCSQYVRPYVQDR